MKGPHGPFLLVIVPENLGISGHAFRNRYMTRPIRQPDLLVRFVLTALTYEGTLKLVRTGYRPAYQIRPDYWTSAHHEFSEASSITTGEQCLAEVWLVTPEAYPHTLWIGRVLDVAEGSRVIGQVEILQVLNPLLVADGSASQWPLQP